MKERKKVLTLDTFLGDLLRTGVDTTLEYLYENREAISNSLAEKLEDLVARKKEEEGEREGEEPVRKIEIPETGMRKE